MILEYKPWELSLTLYGADVAGSSKKCAHVKVQNPELGTLHIDTVHCTLYSVNM
jgi:hypothetical protein